MDRIPCRFTCQSLMRRISREPVRCCRVPLLVCHYAWASPAGQAIPTVAKLLYSLRFSAPVRYYYTTSSKEGDDLVRVGFVEQPSPYSPIYVLPAVNGACPLGATPVRRLFNAVDVLHRYEASVETASVLTANGYVDENIAFCSPPAPV